MDIDWDRLDEVRWAYLAMEELVGLGCTVKTQDGNLHLLNANHFCYLLKLLNDELNTILNSKKEPQTAQN